MNSLKILLIMAFSFYLYGEEVVFTIDKIESKIKYYKNGYEFNSTKNVLDNIRPLYRKDNITILFTKNVLLSDLQVFISEAEKVGGGNYKYYYVTPPYIQEVKFTRIIRKHKYGKYIPKSYIQGKNKIEVSGDKK